MEGGRECTDRSGNVQGWTQTAIENLVVLEKTIDQLRERLGPILNATPPSALKADVKEGTEKVRIHSDVREGFMQLAHTANRLRLQLDELVARVDL